MGVGQGSKVANSGVDTRGERGISFLPCRFLSIIYFITCLTF